MHHMICLLAVAGILLSPITGLANKQYCDRVVIKLKTGQKIVGCFQSKQRDMYGSGSVQITQKGVARNIPETDIEQMDFKKSFWRKAGDIALIPVYVVVTVPAYILIAIACRKNCEL
jgi:hypothetical protein